jgi:hypothetical protein
MHVIKFDSLFEKFAGLVILQVLYKSRYFNLIFIKNHTGKLGTWKERREPYM